ncbi:L-carnitine/gamma-butyrobetaine antiporter [Phosphitispora fastidiosa]|uniref:L-carnitine/gamma-butyrobetaine antiporter n=1 Tax=Phosphitispora fastidiosa TaxID=2837202 RepID=UPI001E42E826|nr:L-carnitine/gamma-butyrobetaine antiporter [Phosphitispora fastidiosa]MBU7005199.1 L-carnitine/gamma-butyrobetaine antiporter [Phosphitispora fastidiosa]
MNRPQRNRLKTDPMVFIPPIILISAFCLYVVWDSQRASFLLESAFDFVTNTFGWAFLWYTVILFGLFLYFVFGPYAHRKLGSGKPEFNTLTWWGMMFTTNCGAGVLFWATMEGFWNFQSPPFGVKPFTHEAATWALSYQLFHWGPLAWAMYTVFGLAFGYLFFVKKKTVVRPSTACEALLGHRLVNGWLGKVVDMCYFFGLIGGTATAMGANTPVVSELFAKTFGIERTLTLDAFILITWTVFIAIIVYSGLNKGIRLLSNFRVCLSIAVILLVLVFGPTRFIMATFTESVGNLLQNFFRMTFYLDPHAESGFPQKWTIFYWAWYLTLLLPTGIYFARISRGRTVREFAVATVASSTLGAWLFFGIFSSHMLDVYYNNLVPIAEILDKSGPAAASVAIWGTLPFGRVMLFVLTVLAYISMATVVNASVYSMAMVSTKELSGYEEPAGWNRVFWSIAMGGLTLALVSLDQFKPVQTVTVITAVPMIVITLMVLVSFMKNIKKEWSTDNGLKRQNV